MSTRHSILQYKPLLFTVFLRTLRLIYIYNELDLMCIKVSTMYITYKFYVPS